MHKQLNCIGPTEPGPITDRRSKKLKIFCRFGAAAASSWWRSMTTEAPGALSACLELLRLDVGGSRPSRAHLAGTVWHWASWSSPSGLSAAATRGQRGFS